MPTPGNLPKSDNINSTTEYFNNYYSERFTTSPGLNDAVIGYFQQITGNEETGKNLASAVIYTALSQGLEPMSRVDEFRKLKAGNFIEQKTPIDSTTVISTLNSYDEINQNKYNYTVGTLFYAPTKDLFFTTKLNTETELLEVVTALNYEAEKINIATTQNPQYVYNYFYVTRTQEKDELTPYLTVLLNYNRVGTSLLGISNQPQSNKYVQRSIRA